MAFHKKIEGKVLEVDANMQGNLNFKDPVNLHINGKFEGNLQARGNLTIGRNANVSGDITGDSVTVGGKVQGKITAKEKLVLLAGASVEGDIYPLKLSVSEGASLEGRCSMLNAFLNSEELAHYLEVDLNSIMEWANSGKVPAVKEGDNWKFERRAIDSWVAAGKIGK